MMCYIIVNIRVKAEGEKTEIILLTVCFFSGSSLVCGVRVCVYACCLAGCLCVCVPDKDVLSPNIVLCSCPVFW